MATADLLDLFESLLSRDSLTPFDVGHSRLYSSWMVVWLMVYQRVYQGQPMSGAVAEMLLGQTSLRLSDCKRAREKTISPSTGGYSQARTNLPVEAALVAIREVARSMIEAEPPSWGERRAFLIDGTSLTTARTPELVRKFPPATNQYGASHWPVIRLVVAHELGSGLAVRPYYGPMYGPQAVSETELARWILEELGGPSMIIYDRNFGIFAMSLAAVEAGHDILVRMTDRRFVAAHHKAVQIRPGEWTLAWTPSSSDLKANPEIPADAVVHGRLVEVAVERKGKTILLRLFTTDMTSTPEELAALYARRWSVEGDIKNVKQVLGLDKLSCRSVEMVEKEILLAMVAYNLVIQVRRLAARQVGIEARRLSFTRVLHLVKAYCRGLETAKTLEEADARFQLLMKSVSQCRLPQRPNFRSYPRELIPRRRRFPTRRRKKPESSVHKN